MKLIHWIVAPLLALAATAAALADPVAWPSTVTSITITTHAVFQSVAVSSLTRHGCFVQNTSSDTEYVFFGAVGSATTANSVQVAPGAAVTCAAGPTVASDALAITSKVTDGATALLITQ